MKKWLILAALVLCLVILEGILRANGYLWKNGESGRELIYRPDPFLGWQSKKGEYTVSHQKDGGKIQVHYWDDGLRATQESHIAKDKRIVLVGGSNVEVNHLADEETFAWKLQEEYPEFEILNYGTVGYGTYQTYLRLQKFFSNSKNKLSPPTLVIYGLIDNHIERNVASAGYIKQLAEQSTGAYKDIIYPYCILDQNGDTLRKETSLYNKWKLHQHSALIGFGEEVSAKISSVQRERAANEIYQHLLRKINDLCERNNSKLIVVTLNRLKEKQKDLLVDGIDFLDCHQPLYALKNNKIELPGRENHDFWSRCISNGIEDIVMEK